MLPSDWAFRYINLRNSAAVPETFSVGYSGTGSWASGGNDNLQITITKCTVTWTYPTNTCGGTSTVLVTQPVSVGASGVAAPTSSTRPPSHPRRPIRPGPSAAAPTCRLSLATEKGPPVCHDPGTTWDRR